MHRELLYLAFSAGLVAALNPCGFAMLPAYLALVVRVTGAGPVRALARAIAATAAMAVGFVAVFGLFGLLTVSAASAVQRFLPYLTVLIGIGLVVLGGWLLAGRDIATDLPNRLLPNVKSGPTARLSSMFGYGLGYAVASLSCTIAPFLAVTGAGFRAGSVAGGLSVFLAYAAGFTLVVGVLAIGAALASTAAVDRLRGIGRYLHRISGALLVVVGLYVGYYGYFEYRMLHTDGQPEDAVIAGAGRVQGAIAGWVHQHGGWPWVIALAILALGALVLAVLSAWRLMRHRRSPRHRSSQSTSRSSSGSGATIA